MDELDPFFWEKLWRFAVGSLVLGSVGILLAALGYKVFDWITPKLEIEKELGEKANIAVAVLVGAVILGVCFIIGMVVN